MDTVRLPTDSNGSSVPVYQVDYSDRIRLQIGGGIAAAVTPVLNRGMYDVRSEGAPVWFAETADAAAAGPYDGTILFPGKEGVVYVTPGTRLGFSNGGDFGFDPNGNVTVEIVVVPLKEAI